MKDQTEGNYSFCPECGALMENGVCPECAKKKEQGVYSSQNYPQEAAGQEPGWNDGKGGYQQQGQYYGQPNPHQEQAGQYYGQQGSWPGQQNPYYGQQNPYPGQQNPYYGQQNPYPGQQNSYYGRPDYPGGNNGVYNPYMKPKKDNRVWIIIGIIAAVLVLLALVVGSFFYGYFLTKLTAGSMESADWYAGEYDFDDYDESGNGSNDGDADYDDGYSYGEDDTYVPSPDDTYYYGPCDSINEDVGYSFITKSYTNEDPEHDIDIIVNYVALKGEDIPNVEQLNETLEKTALYYAVDFPKYSYYAEYGESYAVYTTSYVTYNDEDIVSIVLDEYVVIDGEYHVDLYPINIDVKNGVILDNDSLLQIDSEFAKEFRRRNDEQNGTVDYLDSLSDEELMHVLQDKQSVIAYYTPLGMEVGLNYNSGSASGWVTVTYKDYEKYLTKF